jgi:glutamine synthetase
VGNGVHIHMSLRDAVGALATYASGEPYGLALPARRFFAGVLAHLPEICAVTAPSPVSYLRLRPNRWAPTAANIAMQDRGAAIRVCPVFVADSETDRARQYNVEFRVCDATASPYLALGAIIFAGVDGLRRKLDLPPPADHPLDAMSEAQRAAAGIRALPASLGEALDALERSEAAREWFGATHLGAILRYKRAELANMGALDPTTLCARYAEVY